ncbi:flagellar filament capping protein FliD [Oxalobacteraceae bacterium A2-2]
MASSSVITAPTYDPINTATTLATKYVAGNKSVLASQASAATATASALNTLSSALNTFQTALASLSSSTASLSASSATVSNTAVATATAGAKAVPGSYSFYVSQLATAGQVSYNVRDSVAASSGSLSVTLADGSDFQVDLSNADSNKDGKLSAKEIAAAINVAAENKSRVTASTMTINGVSKLVLTSAQTGADNAVTGIDTSALGDADLKSDLDDANKTVVTAAANAVVWVGGQSTGTRVEQASNTFNVIDNVSFTATKAQAASDADVVLTVARDTTTTTSNVQKFVDAYNAMIKQLKTLTKSGDATTASGPLAADAGVTSLMNRLQGALRTAVGGQSLVNYGITAQRDGTLELKADRLTKAIAANPTGLDTIFGMATTTTSSGVAGSLDTLLDQWTSSTKGQISVRQAAVTKRQADISTRQDALQVQYDSAYKRYLTQFTTLQTLQSTMTTNSNLFTALFSSSSS